MDKKNVIVTGIGGNVGQGIIRNIHATGYAIRVIGTNVIDFSAGNHLCDAFYRVPYAYDAQYIATLQAIAKKEKADLIIPSTDFEAYYLSKYAADFDCTIACSDVKTTGVYLDKYETYLHHSQHQIPFAKAMLPSAYDGSFKEYILKPKKGRGSRGLHINPKDVSVFADEEYMVQDLIRGTEITCAFYVDKKQQLHGMITMERDLENGATSKCVVVDKYDAQQKEIILKMMAHANFKGAANLQSIVSASGEVVPFEINCRISGTNSIRSNFGFKDVQYTLQEYLYEENPEPVNITKGTAVRILMDVIYPEQTDLSQLKDNSVNFHLF
jgi:carbamoyl-phosphate synthase large subunit